MKRLFWLLIPVLLLFSGCVSKITTQYYMMDTVMTFELYGKQAKEAERALSDKIAALEKVFSPTSADSELVAVNRLSGQPIQVSKDFQVLLELSLTANAETNGAFDPTLGGVIDLWQKQNVPSEYALQVQKTGCEHVMLQENIVQTAEGLSFNFGAVAKGYASDCAKAILEEYEIESALLSLGGNIYAKGTRQDGSAWVVGVRDPNGTSEEYLGTVQVKDQFLIASGDYERFFEQGGVRYHHIIDPATRAPAKTDLRETVIICDNGSRGDILSTALFIMGSEQAQEYWREDRGFEMVLVREDNTVLVTAGLKDAFHLVSEEYFLEVIE